jgi:hypothetical protein
MTLELASNSILLASSDSKDFPFLKSLNMPSALINVIVSFFFN